jgi:hypothetical protein
MDGLQSAQQNRDAGVVVIGATNRVCDGITEFHSTVLTPFKAFRSRRSSSPAITNEVASQAP